MTDVWFVAAGWGVILGGLGAYALLLLRRLGAARGAAAHLTRPSDGTPPPGGGE